MEIARLKKRKGIGEKKLQVILETEDAPQFPHDFRMISFFLKETEKELE